MFFAYTLAGNSQNHQWTNAEQGNHGSGGKMIDSLTGRLHALPLQPNHLASARNSQ